MRGAVERGRMRPGSGAAWISTADSGRPPPPPVPASPPRGHRDREGLPPAAGERGDRQTHSPATASDNPGGSPAGRSPALSSSLLITAGGTANAGGNYLSPVTETKMGK